MAARKPAAHLIVWLVWITTAGGLPFAGAWIVPPTACAQQDANAFGREARATPENRSEPVEPLVFLASDRGRERVLDRAKRLAADGRWTDAAVACDEILGHEHDAFVDAIGEGGSLRGQASAMVAGFPRAGRDAYLLLFKIRAEKRLTEAVATNDREAIAAVARRWFETPAGRHAAVMTALHALEECEPLVAARWLDRVAASQSAPELEPTLSVMRAVARRQAGDAEAADALLATATTNGRGTRIGGREVLLSGVSKDGAEWLHALVREPGQRALHAREDWLQPRGGPSRNTIMDASKPLLVPRYRVPLVRHPDEARALEKRRLAAADAGGPLMPAGSPLAAGNFLVVHTPLGILAIDFETGKRLWLESSVALAEPEDHDDTVDDASGRVFDDATSSNLASDGRLVFAVEVTPESLNRVDGAVGGFGFGRGLGRPPPTWDGGNVLRAYDLVDGTLRWQLPASAGFVSGVPNDSAIWFFGAPLVTGSEFYVLAEQGGEVRLECRSSEDGSLRWQQPLANYDDPETIANPAARNRRLAGLTPALADGVIVCPLGAGCVIGVDAASRSLLWAHTYAGKPSDDGAQGKESLPPAGEPSPVIANGFAVLAPYDAPGLFCLRLRDGKPAWAMPKRSRYRVAGVVDDRLIVVSDTAVESLEVATGNRVWKLPLADIGRPSGRGILTPRSFLLPLDTPEVVAIGLADGRIQGRSRSRGGTIPGNLVAHRGEIISRGVDTLEVFHQETALESRIETARAREPSSPWAAYWGGQVAIEQGDVKHGLELVALAVTSPSLRLAPGDLAATLVRALDRDFAVASAWLASHTSERLEPAVLRKLVDGFLASGDAARAWDAFLPLLMADRPGDEAVFRDATDPWLVITADRWIRGRLKRIGSLADPPLAAGIDEECRAAITKALARADAPDNRAWLAALAERLGPHPAASELRRSMMTSHGEKGSRQQAVRDSLAALESAAARSARASLEGASAANAPSSEASAWPIGAVSRTMHAPSKRAADHGRMHPIPLVLVGAGAYGTRTMQASLDGSQRRLVISDGLGNAVGDPIPLEGVSQELMPWGSRAMEVAVVGRALFVRTRKELAAYDLEAGLGRSRGLWRRPDFAAPVDSNGDGRWAWGVGGRVARDGWVPLGMRISEPDEAPRGDGRGMVALPGFVVVPGPRSIALLDPAGGHLIWERRRLPPGLEWTVDADFLCGLSIDGSRSLVLDTTDGRMIHQVDIPHRRQRVATHGRCVVTIRSIDELPGRFTARRVRLELLDPATRQTRSLGEFSGEARATEAGDGRLAVMEPGGRLTLIDLDAATSLFRVALPEPPKDFRRLIVQRWSDRYLVLAGSPVEGEEAEGVSPLQQLMLASPASTPMSGRLWALDHVSGESLWQAPAIIDRHCLHTAQPPDLPVLAFCRLLHGPGERTQTRLSLLMLDKRTGHAVLDDDRISIPSHAFLGCEIVGSTEKHMVTVAEPAGGAARLTLTFTGEPIPPQPPYRGSDRFMTSRVSLSLKGVGRLFEQDSPDDDHGAQPAQLRLEPEGFK